MDSTEQVYVVFLAEGTAIEYRVSKILSRCVITNTRTELMIIMEEPEVRECLYQIQKEKSEHRPQIFTGKRRFLGMDEMFEDASMRRSIVNLV